MINKQKSCKFKYTSCVRINGKPILPPLITTSKLEEIQCYKTKALGIEERLKQNRMQPKARPGKIGSTTQITSIEHQISFSENDPHPQTRQPEFIPRENDVPFSIQSGLNLTCDLIDVTEYSNDGIRLFNNQPVVDYAVIKDNNPAMVETETTKDNVQVSENAEEGAMCLQKKPALIRSNSYTLESPSPVLLAHLRNMSLESSMSNETELRKLISLDSDRSDQENEASCSARSSCDITQLELPSKAGESLPPQKTDESLENCPEISEKSDEIEEKEKDQELLKMLSSLSKDEKEQLFQLLKLDGRRQLTTDERATNELLASSVSLCSDNENLESLAISQSIPFFAMNNLSMLPYNETVSFTSYSFEDETKNIMVRNASDTNGVVRKEVIVDLLETRDISEPENAKDSFLRQKVSSDTIVRNIINCSKELFPEDDVWMEKQLKQEWAASIIGAHVKGYLTRRLLATDRVRALIDTIKDALICAMELHAESTENIKEADVELHRRLIQQVSAACYAFHDVFFMLSIPEQMAIIANDRRRQKEKALKLSNSSLSSTSSIHKRSAR